MLVKHIRNSQGHPVGTVVATSRNHVGYSFCSHGDKFCKKRGIQIATGRARIGITRPFPYEGKHPYTIDGQTVSEILYAEVEHMRSRAARYFKQEALV